MNDFGLAPLKPEGSISMIVDNENIEDGQNFAVNNAMDKLIMYSAKQGFCPNFGLHDLQYGTQVIAYRRK